MLFSSFWSKEFPSLPSSIFSTVLSLFATLNSDTTEDNNCSKPARSSTALDSLWATSSFWESCSFSCAPSPLFSNDDFSLSNSHILTTLCSFKSAAVSLTSHDAFSWFSGFFTGFSVSQLGSFSFALSLTETEPELVGKTSSNLQSFLSERDVTSAVGKSVASWTGSPSSEKDFGDFTSDNSPFLEELLSSGLPLLSTVSFRGTLSWSGCPFWPLLLSFTRKFTGDSVDSYWSEVPTFSEPSVDPNVSAPPSALFLLSISRSLGSFAISMNESNNSSEVALTVGKHSDCACSSWLFSTVHVAFWLAVTTASLSVFSDIARDMLPATT